MNRFRQALEQMSRRQAPRGPQSVLADARRQADRARSRRRTVAGLAAAAALLVVVAGLAALVQAGDEASRVETGPADSPTTSAPTPTTEPSPEPTSTTQPTPGQGETTVDVFFGTGADPTCAEVVPVERFVEGPAVLEGALEALLAGPTDDELADGLTSWFSEDTEGALRSITIANGTARIDFESFAATIPNASTSCGSAALISQLDATARQFPTVARTVYSFDGDPDAFYGWLQREAPEANPDWGGEVQVDVESGTVAAPGFDDFVTAEVPGWAFDPREAAVVLLDMGSQPEGRTVEVTQQEATGGQVVVTVTVANLRDDSVNAERYTITFDTAPDVPVSFVDGSYRVRCQPGRGHQDFSTELCA